MTADSLERDLWLAAIGAVLAAAVAFGGAYAIGSLGAVEAIGLIQSSLPTSRFLASALMTASATILALMLTLLSMSYGTDFRLRPIHYRRVRIIALVDAAAFVAATIFLLLLNIPVEETKNVPTHWYDTIYYLMLGVSSALGGLLIGIVLMLYHTVRDVIRTVSGEEEGPLMVDDDSDEPIIEEL